MSTTGRLDVVVARMAPGLAISSRVAKIACLTESSSTVASTKRSQSARSSNDVLPENRPSAASRSSSVSLPRTTAFSSDRPIAARALSICSVPRARSTTSYPALANTSAMPTAMVPEPTIPTRWTGRVVESSPFGTGVCASATTTGESGAS